MSRRDQYGPLHNRKIVPVMVVNADLLCRFTGSTGLISRNGQMKKTINAHCRESYMLFNDTEVLKDHMQTSFRSSNQLILESISHV